jgi:hypothetical protein
VGAAAFSSAF